jgi:hypothetical protein
MNGLQFASSFVSSLAWPLVVIVLVVIFRKQLAHLIGRIKSYKGLGQEVTFGERLADAENSVEEAASSVPVDKAEPGPVEVEPSPLVQEAELNPSFVVIRSWGDVVKALNNLARIALRGWPSYGLQGYSPSALRDLQESGVVKPSFVTAVTELHDLRNKVAHGLHNPTPGEAVTYANSASQLVSTAERIRLNKLSFPDPPLAQRPS